MMSPNQQPVVIIVMPLADQRGGAELSLLQLMQNANSIRWHIVFLIEGPMLDQARALGIPVKFIDGGRVRQPWKMLAAIRSIGRWAREVNADAMLGWMAKAHLYSGPAAKMVGIPAVWFQHGLPSPHGVIDNLANRIPAIGALACSRYSADCQLQVTPRLDIRVVHPGVDFERLNLSTLPLPDACRAKLSLPLEGPIIGIFGRLQSWKGMHVLLEALPIVLEKYPLTHALIVGGIWEPEAAYEKRLHEQTRKMGIEKKVIFAGHQTNVSEWMQACTVIVHHSEKEPFGMVVIEAMALGKPVIAGINGGPKEAVTEGVTGFLVPHGDSAGLAGSILKYLDNPALAGEMGEAARKRAREFSVQQFAEGVSRAMKDWIYSSSAAVEPKPVNV